MSTQELKPGVYVHHRGDYYLVLWTATLNESVKKDQDVDVFLVGDVDGFHAAPSDSDWRQRWEAENFAFTHLLTARAHADYFPHPDSPLDVVVYVPLYHHKPGRRISVRDVKDFFEMVDPSKCTDCPHPARQHPPKDGSAHGGCVGSIDAERCYCANRLGGVDPTPIQRFFYIGNTIPGAK